VLRCISVLTTLILLLLLLLLSLLLLLPLLPLLQLLTEFTTPPQFALFNSPAPKRKDSDSDAEPESAEAAAAAAAAAEQEPLLNSYKHDGDGSWHMLSLGQSRAGLPIHVHGETWLGLVYGAKRWFLYPPGKRYCSFIQNSLQKTSLGCSELALSTEHAAAVLLVCMMHKLSAHSSCQVSACVASCSVLQFKCKLCVTVVAYDVHSYHVRIYILYTAATQQCSQRD
jgi:hypothetical protein